MHLESYNCVLCQNTVEESTQHLFLSCQFAKDCWNLIGIAIQTDNDVFTAINQIRDQSHPVFFMAVIILMCWAIWTARNDVIFKRTPASFLSVKALFLKELKLLSLRAKTRFSETFDLWIQNLL